MNIILAISIEPIPSWNEMKAKIHEGEDGMSES
jgi:hypothetical protein